MITASFTANGVFGDVYSSEFVFTDISSSTHPVVSRYWSFGDGHFLHNDSIAKHFYTFPGTYTVTLSVADNQGNVGTAHATAIVDYAVRDKIIFSQIPPVFSEPGIPTPTPFKVSLTSAQINQPLIVQLHAANSRSLPYELVPDKWKFLTPTWRFLDKDLNFIKQLTIPTAPIFKNGRVVGVSGEAEFYYIDDLGADYLAGDCALLITATLLPSSFNYPLETQIYNYPSYANSNVSYASVAWQINTLAPEYLKITSNYLDKISPTKWVGAKIPVLLTAHSYRNTLNLDLSGKLFNSGILFSHPLNNSIGKDFEVVLTLSGVSPSAYKVDNTPLFFQKTDNNNLQQGGYIFTTITPHEPIVHTAVVATVSSTLPLTATTFSLPYGHPPPPFVWVSNPEHSTLHRVTITPTSPTCSAINAFSKTGGVHTGSTLVTNVPVLSIQNVSNYALSGFSGIFGLAIDTRNQHLIAADAETDTIYRFDPTGRVLSAVSLRAPSGVVQTVNGLTFLTNLSSTLVIGYDSTIGFTPSYVSLDRNYNIWVSLFDSVSVVKFDKDFNFLRAAAPPNNEYQINVLGDWLFKPPVVETDMYNNIWVTYAQVLCSAIFKYNSEGQFLLKINLPSDYLPVGIAITPSNDIWVTNTMHTSPNDGNLQHYSSTGTLMATITGFARPSYISLDRQGGVWFTHGFREIGYIDPSTHNAFSWTLSSNSVSGVFLPISIPDPTFITHSLFDEELGGLTIDVYDRLWVIDSQHNILHMVSATPHEVTTTPSIQIPILPTSNIGFVPSITTSLTMMLTSAYYKSAQAAGDWSGNRWLQKYGSTPNALQGISAPFTVYDYDNNFRIKKINESFNTAKQYQSLALPENLNKNETLFSNFLPAVVGSGVPSKYEDIGEISYERIANFLKQHTDIDTCGVEQLLSHCKSMDVDTYEYLASLPVEIKNALDLFSISKEKLRGYLDNLPILEKSVGEALNTATTLVTAGQKMFLHNKFSATYSLITIPLLSGLAVYPLSSFDSAGLSQPFFANYLFYEYTPTYPYDEEKETTPYIENIIDWNNQFTTFHYNISSKKDWYDENGVVEKIFNYLLTKNLFLNS